LIALKTSAPDKCTSSHFDEQVHQTFAEARAFSNQANDGCQADYADDSIPAMMRYRYLEYCTPAKTATAGQAGRCVSVRSIESFDSVCMRDNPPDSSLLPVVQKMVQLRTQLLEQGNAHNAAILDSSICDYIPVVKGKTPSVFAEVHTCVVCAC
jgi:hypothetical protein